MGLDAYHDGCYTCAKPMAELRLSLDVRISPRVARAGLAALLMVFYAPELVSESVSLTTYYPAPSGIYTQMITTSNTWLGRDGGNIIAGNGAASGKLAIYGGNLTVNGGNDVVMSAGSELQMGGAAINGTFGIVPNYANWASYGTGGGGAAIYNSNEAAYQALMLVGNNSGGGVRRVKIWDEMTVNGNSIMNGNVTASGNVTAGGKIQAGVNGHGVFPVSSNYCYTVTVARNGGSMCAAGYYITLVSGVFSRYYAVPQPMQSINTGTGGSVPAEGLGALCCPCPSGGCPG